MKVICVIPAWNESKNISKVISQVRPFVAEVVVIDDASRDDTASLATAAGATVLSHPINRGQGAALQTGNDYALGHGADIIVHFDADDQFQASEIKDVIAPLLAGQADIVFGSRFLGKKSQLPRAKRYLIMPLAKLFNRLFFGIKLSDPQNGFRAMTKETAQKIRISNREMAHNSEIQAKAFRARLRITEVPITVTYHDFGQRFSGGLKIIRDLVINKIIK